MRLSIRSKLMAGVGVPLVVFSIGFVIMESTYLHREAIKEAERFIEARARHHADRFDGLFKRLAQLGTSTAHALEAAEFSDPKFVMSMLERSVAQDPMVYGACVAFEPESSANPQRLHAPYVHRSAGGLVHMDVADAYDYTDAKWDWYRLPKESGRPLWTEPFFDRGAGDIVMCTYVTPFFRKGVFGGTTNIDLPLSEIQSWIDPEEFGDGLFVIVSRDGRFVSHPNPDIIMKESIQSISKEPGLEELPDVLAEARRGGSGVVRLPRLIDGEPAFLAFAPIPSAGWTFGAAIPERTVLEPVDRGIVERCAVLAVFIAAIIGLVLTIAMRITRPIEALADSVRHVAEGKLVPSTALSRATDEIGDLSRAFSKMVIDLRSHIDARTQEAAARQRIESELKIARQIQTTLLPKEAPDVAEGAPFVLCAQNAAAHHVAGDFFDHFLLDEHQLVFLIADVAGKGMPAALLMAVSQTVTRNLAPTSASPDVLAARVNAHLTSNQENSLFVTMFIAYYDRRTSILRYANAGHLAPILLRNDGRRERLSDADAPPIGVLPDVPFISGERHLTIGDTLVLFTDGTTEARDKSGRFFGEERLMGFLDASAGASPKDRCQGLVRAVSVFQEEVLRDDVTVLVFARTA